MNEQIEAVQRMQDYIDQHLYESVTLAELSKVSMYSPWYSYRLFKSNLGVTPSDYIRKLRLSKSALRLRDEKIKVIDVALESGYDSTDGYQRAFYNEFGCNPKEYAQNPVPIYLFKPYKIKYSNSEEKNMEKVKNIYIQQITKSERKVIIKRGIKAEHYFDYCSEVGCDVWGLLMSMKSLCGEPVCLWLPQKYIKPNTSKYVQGVEVSLDYNGSIPDGFDIITLPECKYLKFQSEPFKEEDYGVTIQQVWEAIDKYNFEAAGLKIDDENPRIQLEPIGERGYIELVPVK